MNSKYASRLSRAIGATLLLYIFLTLPLLILFSTNWFSRTTQLRIASHYAAKTVDPITIHIGDSITAGGGEWSTALFGYPLRSINLAGNGYTVWQVKAQASEAIKYSPTAICVMAGTNDILGDPNFDLDQSLRDYSQLINTISDSGITCIVTLIPYIGAPESPKNAVIEQFNQRLLEISTAQNARIIDLNSRIAPNHVLLNEFTTDGVHFSPATYAIWVQEIRKQIKESNGR